MPDIREWPTACQGQLAYGSFDAPYWPLFHAATRALLSRCYLFQAATHQHRLISLTPACRRRRHATLRPPRQRTPCWYHCRFRKRRTEYQFSLLTRHHATPPSGLSRGVLSQAADPPRHDATINAPPDTRPRYSAAIAFTRRRRYLRYVLRPFLLVTPTAPRLIECHADFHAARNATHADARWYEASTWYRRLASALLPKVRQPCFSFFRARLRRQQASPAGFSPPLPPLNIKCRQFIATPAVDVTPATPQPRHQSTFHAAPRRLLQRFSPPRQQPRQRQFFHLHACAPCCPYRRRRRRQQYEERRHDAHRFADIVIAASLCRHAMSRRLA